MLAGCGQSTPPSQSSQGADSKVSKHKLDQWSWLPKTTKHDAEIAQIPPNAEIGFSIPKDEPLDAESVGFGMRVDPYGNMTPVDKGSYVVKGGALVSKLGSIEKKAKWGDWDFVYEDASHTKKAGWGPSLTSGEILLPRKWFLDPPTDRFVQNSFEIESFGDDYVLIHLDPTKGHRLCFMKIGSSNKQQTAAFIGSKAEVNGKVFERKADGWYSGNTRLSE
jgi:hypothetical protein